ncbi:MAG: hypothetical protein ABJB12_18220 [Pseudomonadota bacterium]
MTRLFAAASVLLLAAGCSTTRVGPPPEAARLTRPLSAMPADLDLVLRVDLKRIRDTLGEPAMAALSEQALHGVHGADHATDELLLKTLSQTDALYVGMRPSAAGRAADSVFVLVGHFPGFAPDRAESSPRFHSALDLGGDLRRYDRPAPQARSAPARFYARGDELIVALSEAEIDSVERTLEQGRGRPPLEPAEKGALSAVLRPRALPRELFGGSRALRELAQDASRVELDADLNSAGVDANLALKFDDPSAAGEVGRALTGMRDALKTSPGRLAKFAARVEITNAAEFVTLHFELGRDEFSELVNCRGAACDW